MRIRFACFLVCLGLILTACEDSAGPAGSADSLRFALSLASAGGVDAAFDRADRLLVRVSVGDVVIKDTVIAFASEGDDVRLRVRIPEGNEGVSAGVYVELRLGDAPLFTGSGATTLAPDAPPVEITLMPVIARIEPPAQLTIGEIGGSLQLVSAAVFATGDTIPGIPITYRTLDPNIVSVTPNGLVTGLSEGDGRVEARAATVLSMFTVRVRLPVASVVVRPDRANLQVGSTVQFTAQAFGTAGQLLNRTFTWASSDNGIVSVDPSGRATGVAVGSAEIRATVDGVTGTADATVTTLPPPAPPTGLNATAAGSTITLRWTDNATNETRYEVHRGPTGGALASIATLPAGATSYQDVSTPDQVYDYEVLACNTETCEASERITARTVPLPPSNLTLMLLDSATRRYRLDWLDNSVAETRFDIQYYDTATATWEVLVDVSPGSQPPAAAAAQSAGPMTYEGVGSHGTQMFRVLACNGAGCSAPTNTVTQVFYLDVPDVTTLPTGVPTLLRGLADGHGEPYEVWFEYSEFPDFTYSEILSLGTQVAANNYSAVLDNLVSGVTYFYRISARNVRGQNDGQIEAFTTPLGFGNETVVFLCDGSPTCTSEPPDAELIAYVPVSAGSPSPFQSVQFQARTTFGNVVDLGVASASYNGSTSEYEYRLVFKPGAHGFSNVDVFIDARGLIAGAGSVIVGQWDFIVLGPS